MICLGHTGMPLSVAYRRPNVFLLRMDFRYRSDDAIDGWTTCEWLVKEGERYNQMGERSADVPAP